MPRNSGGTYSLPSGNPVVAGTTIEAAWANNTLSDVGNELTNSLSRQGTGGMLAALRLADGSVTVPGLAFVSETTTGFYRAASNDMRMAILGSDVWAATSSAFTISKAVTLSVASNLGTPSALTLTNATGLPLTTGVTGTLPVANGGTGITAFGTGVATALGQNVTGSGGIVLATSPTLTTPNLGTPSAVTLTNATGLPIATGVSGLGTGVATALAVNTGSSGAFVVNGGALGTPSSGTVTNLTGTASININGTVGATTPTTGAFTTITASGQVRGGSSSGGAQFLGTDTNYGGSRAFFATQADAAQRINVGHFDSSTVSFPTGLVPAQILAGVSDLHIATRDTAGASVIFRAGSGVDEVARLNSTGLGIGTNNPGQRLDVSGADGVRARVVALAGGTPGLILSSSGNTAYTFKAGNADNSLRIDQDGNDRITLASGGNLGIGTSSPAYSVDIRNAASTALRVGSNGNSFGTLLSWDNPLGEARLWSLGAYALVLGTNGTERARFDSSGNLGIGTSSPVVKLDVNGAAVVRGTFTPTDAITMGGNTSAPTADAFIFRPANNTLAFGTANTERMRLDSSGNFGLGVTPSAWWSAMKPLQMSGNGFIGSASNYTYVGANFFYNSSANPVYVASAAASLYEQGAGAHKWLTAPSGTAGNAISFTQAMTLDASGNLGVGVTGPTAKLHIYEPTAAATRIRVLANGGQQAALQLAGNGTTFGTTSFDVFQDGGSDAYVANRANAALQFWTNNTERARITSGGNLLVGTTTDAGSRVTITAGAATNAVNVVVPTVDYFGAVFHNQATSGDNVFLAFGTEASFTTRGSIIYNRAGGLVAYNTTSDYRAKDIIGPVQNPGAVIDALKVYEGRMKGATQTRPMLVAHEAQEVAPYAVSGTKDEVNPDGTPKFQQIDVSSLVPLLLAELQSLRARVAQLERH